MGEPSSEKPKQPGPPRKPTGPEGGGDQPRSMPGMPWLLIIVVGMLVLYLMMADKSPESTGVRVDYWFFLEQLKQGETGNVKEVMFHGHVLTGKWRKTPKNPDKDGSELTEEFNTYLPDSVVLTLDLEQELNARGVERSAESADPGIGAQLLVWMIGPLLLIGFFWFMMRRQADPMGGGMMGNFVRSPAKRFFGSEQKTTFDDVAGMEQAKSELAEIVEFLKTPAKFQRLGAEIPKGVLLMGPPGTGKTLLARATAGEAGVPFYSINGSEFIQMFVGVGATRVRDLFKTAKDNAPCLIFIDEIDAVGRVRGAGLGGGHDEREQTLNQMLSEMDGFQQNEAVIVLAATNRPDVLDQALLRPGRFDRHVTIDRPNKKGRLGILKVHCRKVPLGDSVDLDVIAGSTIGFSGADLKNLVNEAALGATRNNRNAVEDEDFENARDKVIMGPKRDDILNVHEREMTAYHEAGHALLAWLLPDVVDVVHKVTIIPRGRALGVTQLVPGEERYHIGEKRLHSQLCVALGGRAAEKMIFDEYSAGAEDDLKRATGLARKMVAHWGMSEVIGPVTFRQADEHPFLGKEMHEQREFSEETAFAIDQEVQRFLREANQQSMDALTENRKKLQLLATELLERESLDRDELVELFGDPVVAESSKRSDDA